MRFGFQDYALFPNKTVSQNISFGKGSTDDPDRIGELMEMADIAGLEQRYPHEISGGQQQRVALVRALATRPSLLLLDEPLSHLDPELRDSVRTELLKLFRETDTTALFVSHDIEDAMVMADRMVVLREEHSRTGRHARLRFTIDRPARTSPGCSAKRISSRLAYCRMHPTPSRQRRAKARSSRLDPTNGNSSRTPTTVQLPSPEKWCRQQTGARIRKCYCKRKT